MTRGFDFRWKGAPLGWVVNTPFYMNDFEILSACRYVWKVQAQRLRALPPGDRRDDLERAMAELAQCKITQRIIPENDHSLELNLFKASAIPAEGRTIYSIGKG